MSGGRPHVVRARRLVVRFMLPVPSTRSLAVPVDLRSDITRKANPSVRLMTTLRGGTPDQAHLPADAAYTAARAVSVTGSSCTEFEAYVHSDTSASRSAQATSKRRKSASMAMVAVIRPSGAPMQ